MTRHSNGQDRQNSANARENGAPLGISTTRGQPHSLRTVGRSHTALTRKARISCRRSSCVCPDHSRPASLPHRATCPSNPLTVCPPGPVYRRATSRAGWVEIRCSTSTSQVLRGHPVHPTRRDKALDDSEKRIPRRSRQVLDDGPAPSPEGFDDRQRMLPAPGELRRSLKASSCGSPPRAPRAHRSGPRPPRNPPVVLDGLDISPGICPATSANHDIAARCGPGLVSLITVTQ